MIELVVRCYLFVAFLFGVQSYYSYKNMEVHNQLALSKENFKVMVNAMSNATISVTEDSNLGYCN